MDQFEVAEKLANLSIEQIKRNQESWMDVEKLFREFSVISYSQKEVAPVYELMKSVIATDLVKLFRAGHSMWTLMISTEPEERFSSHQPFIAIEVESDFVQIKYMHTKGNVVLQKETCGVNVNGLEILAPYFERLWNETKRPV